MPFSELARVSVALDSTAPVGSVTTPESVAVVVASCALIHGVPLATKASRIANSAQLQRDRGLRLLFVFKMQPPSGFSPSFLVFRGARDTCEEVPRDRGLKSTPFLGFRMNHCEGPYGIGKEGLYSMRREGLYGKESSLIRKRSGNNLIVLRRLIIATRQRVRRIRMAV